MTDAFPCLIVEIPGQIRNPLNSHWGHFKYSRWKERWRRDVSTLVRMEVNRGPWAGIDLSLPKDITIKAYVRSCFDEDGLAAACKPIRDALQGIMIDSDHPSHGHDIKYAQEIDRRHPLRVVIRIALRA